ncbi:ArnT family glycosyltransferase [Vibrio sp. TRT 21S02]|uniref:ArnT family glycosyltransferase n=1 Tax=Vibrio sp. TRT 21S02 TaxID=3418507 RepID=UPI003CEE5E26
MMLKRVHLWSVLATVLLVRLLSLGAYPLMDTTEARYGEMARLMVETGNWLTPQFDYGVPFWGKPPLFTWMSAAGIEWFGVNEFAVRAPHWLAGVLVIALMAYFARRVGIDALMTAVILATCGVFAVAAGAVMTDMALTLGISLAMAGFYLCWQGRKAWAYVGFVGLAIGLLAKGPLTIVLVGLAIFPWLLLRYGPVKMWGELWHRIPLVSGTLLMLLIALPWYLLAEQATPGFLNYFIVGEHIKRFLVSGWEGDLYGSAHQRARGTIWLYWLYASAPWSFILPVVLWFKRKQIVSWWNNDGLLSFALFWMMSPLILFTFSGNILPAYVLPSVPALALILAMFLSQSDSQKLWFQITTWVLPILLMLAVVFIEIGVSERKSDKALLAEADQNIALFYVGKRPFSGQFYSKGQAKVLQQSRELEKYQQVQLVGNSEQVEALLSSQKMDCVLVKTAASHRSLYQCRTP